jgi:hypothetical protein
MFVYCLLAHQIWRRIGKILNLTYGQTGTLVLSLQKILFHKHTCNSIETTLIIAGKYAIALLTRMVSNKPKHPKVIDAFFKTQLNQIADTYDHVRLDMQECGQIRNWMAYVLKLIDLDRGG